MQLLELDLSYQMHLERGFAWLVPWFGSHVLLCAPPSANLFPLRALSLTPLPPPLTAPPSTLSPTGPSPALASCPGPPTGARHIATGAAVRRS